MEGIVYEAEKLGVDPAWLAARSTIVGQSRCPQCWPDHDIIAEGNFIEPCNEHGGSGQFLAAPDDVRVTAPAIDIVVAGTFV